LPLTMGDVTGGPNKEKSSAEDPHMKPYRGKRYFNAALPGQFKSRIENPWARSCAHAFDSGKPPKETLMWAGMSKEKGEVPVSFAFCAAPRACQNRPPNGW